MVLLCKTKTVYFLIILFSAGTVFIRQNLTSIDVRL